MRMTVAATQMACTWDRAQNIEQADALVREAHSKGARVVLLPELFETPYFCQEQDEKYFALAHDPKDSAFLRHFQTLAAELEVVLPLSFFERSGRTHYNSLMLIDADGERLGVYRKSHIPDGPGYQEKFYFRPGNTGLHVFPTRFGRVGPGICWDQWFPEVARGLALAGADVLFYPTAIGSEPANEALHTRDAWTRAMQGHAVVNRMPVVASNRIGTETFGSSSIEFYGSSFIAGPDGELIERLSETEPGVAVAEFDLAVLERERAGWGFFRDRRPELYGDLVG